MKAFVVDYSRQNTWLILANDLVQAVKLYVENVLEEKISWSDEQIKKAIGEVEEKLKSEPVLDYEYYDEDSIQNHIFTLIGKEECEEIDLTSFSKNGIAHQIC